MRKKGSKMRMKRMKKNRGGRKGEEADGEEEE